MALVLGILAGQAPNAIMTVTHLRKAFIARGHSDRWLQPALNRLADEGRVDYNERGVVLPAQGGKIT